MRLVVMLRKQKGITQRGLAAKAHVNSMYMNLFETGRANPSAAQAKRVARALGYDGDPMDLFEEIDAAAVIAAMKEER